MTEDRPSASPSAPPRRSTYQPPSDEVDIDEATSLSRRNSASRPEPESPTARRYDPLDDTTTLARRRSAPEGDAASRAASSADPLDEATSVSRRRGASEGLGDADDRGDESTPGPRRSGAGSGSSAGSGSGAGVVPTRRLRRAAAARAAEVDELRAAEVDEARAAEVDELRAADAVEDTILRIPSAASAAASEAPRPVDNAMVTGSGRAAYVPTAEHVADRRAPRKADSAVAPRRQDRSPRSLDLTPADALGPASGPAGRRRARIRMLILVGGVAVAAALGVVALVLLLS